MIDEGGSVAETRVVHSIPELDGAAVRAIRDPASDSWRIVAANGDEWTADAIVPAGETNPDVAIAAAAGVKLGSTGAIAVGRRMETNLADVYAAGACAEAPNAILVYEATWEPMRRLSPTR